jgi:pyruvate ferredoxin oxidoreductase alpha subunit
MRELLTGNKAAAWGARLADVDYLPVFPITPQTEIIETLAEWIDHGRIEARLTILESEHSMVTAAGAAAATGVRVFTATSSQGLLYAMEMLYNLAGWRVPLVLVNVSRGLSAPITLEPDHNDVLAARDCGFLQLHCTTCQEVLDSVLLGYRLAEDMRVRLPVLVNLDGFYLSFTREPVEIPSAEQVRAFLPPFHPGSNRFAGGTPVSQAVAVLGGTPYSYFRYQAHLASLEAGRIFGRIAQEFEARFGRSFEAVEDYHCDDAEILFVMIGSFASKARAAVDSLRASGQKVGLVRPRLLRPFPVASLVRLFEGKAGVAVVDQNLSNGSGGILHTELAAALYPLSKRPLLVSFVGGLGGRDITAGEFFAMHDVVRRAVGTGQAPPPQLLFTKDELAAVRHMQDIAAGTGETS